MWNCSQINNPIQEQLAKNKKWTLIAVIKNSNLIKYKSPLRKFLLHRWLRQILGLKFKLGTIVRYETFLLELLVFSGTRRCSRVQYNYDTPDCHNTQETNRGDFIILRPTPHNGCSVFLSVPRPQCLFTTSAPCANKGLDLNVM